MRRNPSALAAVVLAALVGSTAAMAGLPEYQAVVLNEPSLLSYYTFDADTAPNVLDVAPADPHNGTLQGTATFVTGVGGSGQALSSSGGTGGGWVNIGAVADFAFADGTGTVEAWIQHPSGFTASNSVVAACRSGGPVRYSIHVESTTYTNVWTSNSWCRAEPFAQFGVSSMPVNTWSHLAYVFDGEDVRVYINGRFAPDRCGFFALGPDLGTTFQIGSSSETGQEVWQGLIDEVAVYADALTQAQIMSHVAMIQPSIVASPDEKVFFTAGDMGPTDVALSLVGAVGAAGGTALTLTYTNSVISVTSATDPPVTIPSGGTVTVPAGATEVVVRVSGVAVGGPTTLTVAGAGLASGTAQFTVRAPPSARMQAYQNAVKSTPSLISYYTFDDDVTGAADVAPTDPHDGVFGGFADSMSFIPRPGDEGGSAFYVIGRGMLKFGPVSDFAFPDGTGTVEGWLRVTSSSNIARTWAASREGETRYSLHLNVSADTAGVWSSAGGIGSGWCGISYPFATNTWYHVAYVYNGADVQTYVNAVPIADGCATFALGGNTSLPFLLGARGMGDENERWYGQIDEVALYEEPLTEAQILGHFLELQPFLTMTPARRFFSPGDMGPTNVTLALVGTAGGVGGTPITLTYDAAVIAVTTSTGTPVPSGGTVSVEAGATTVAIKVSGVAPGSTDLVASGTNLLPATGQFGVRPAPSAQMLAYQAAVLGEPSLISYYTFDTEPDGAVDRAPVASTPAHNGTLAGVVQLAPRTDAGAGGAMEVTGLGHANFGPISDFNFIDGTGTIEAWVRPSWTAATDPGDLVVAANRSGGPVRYSAHVGSGRNWINAWTGKSWARGQIVPNPDVRWYHMAWVFDAGNTARFYIDGVLQPAEYDSPYNMELGETLDATFQIGSSSEGGQERFRGGLDEVAIYEDALTSEQIAAHAAMLALSLSPAKAALLLPTDPGPVVVTLALPTGMSAPAGGVPVALTFDPAIVQITAGGPPLVSGSVVTVPEGTHSVDLAVTGLHLGGTTLAAAASGFLGDSTELAVRADTADGIIIVQDNFDDNPTGDPALDLPALAMNGVGPGAGWLGAMYTKTHRETGTGGGDGFWQVLADGGAYHRTSLTAKGPDEFDVMTTEGVRVSWKIIEAHTTVDDTTSKPAFPGGETADCYHQFGLVSANRINLAGCDNEMYDNNGGGGLYVGVLYDTVAGNSDAVLVTAYVRAVNKTKPWYHDVEPFTGMQTIATATLPGITQPTLANPLYVNIKANAGGWQISFSENAAAVWTITPDLSGVGIGPANTLTGDWSADSLGAAPITDEFANGAFATAQLQNLGAGRGSGTVDQLIVCTNCSLPGDCPNPFADADRDGDVDLDDFGRFQQCYTGVGVPAGVGCGCFEREGNGNRDVSVVDLFAFTACFSGPSVKADRSCDGD